jgi:hypothetical protein
MSVSLATLPLKQGLTALTDLITALNDHLASLSEDEQVVSDGLNIATVFVPALIPVAVALPAAEFLLDMLITHNRSADPGALSPIASGKKGSDPWQT